MKFADDFESFLRLHVNLVASQLDMLQDRIAAIEEFVADHPTFTPYFLDTIPSGSWAHRTIIKPVRSGDEFDADVLLYLKEEHDWLPRQYIEELYTAFQKDRHYAARAERKTRCVRIKYSGQFHVDVVPYMERAGSHWITNRAEPEGHGRFEASNPPAFTRWLDERQRATAGSFIKVVRLVKFLRDFKRTFTCKSIILTTLLGSEVNAIDASYHPEQYSDVPSALVTILNKLAHSLPLTMPAVMDPAGTGDNFTDRYKDTWDYSNFRSRIVNYAAKVEAAYEAQDREESIGLWRDVFGDQFKPGLLRKVASLAPLSAAVAWSGESFIDGPPYNYETRLDPRCTVRVEGRCTGFNSGQSTRRNGFRQFKLAEYGGRVPKNRSLQFDASVSGASGYELYWKVRNGGLEAQEADQLRGEITRVVGSNSKSETTLFRGTHYVECYVVSGGRVIGKDRQTVIVT